MKRFHVLVLAATLGLALLAGLGQAAAAAGFKQAGSLARGRIGNAAPTSGAAARIRALGLDDGGDLASDDGEALKAGGRPAHGTIGSALPRAGAAARIAALGLDD
jgi:hypothetical protein